MLSIMTMLVITKETYSLHSLLLIRWGTSMILISGQTYQVFEADKEDPPSAFGRGFGRQKKQVIFSSRLHY